jgi:O-acetyl-ADP-ribose deacetylase (regulator of RNase III)
LLEKRVNQKKFLLIQGSIIEEDVEAIVNPANENLAHGGGVAGLISRTGGDTIQTESNKKSPVKTGQAVYTTAGELPFKFIIHTVGPVWKGGSQNEASLLKSAIFSTLKLADRLGLKSVSLPAISTGIFGYPLKLAITIITSAIVNFLNRDSHLQEIHLCEYSREKSQEIKKIIEIYSRKGLE